MKVPVIDFEASSLKPYHSYPIQVGCVFEDGVTYGALIRPHESWNDWNKDSEQVHGISRERLFDEGEDIRVVAETLNKMCSEVMYCDGGIFDIMWADMLFGTACVSRQFQLASFIPLLSSLDVQYNGNMIAYKHRAAEDLNLELHDAVNDALIIQRAIEMIITR